MNSAFVGYEELSRSQWIKTSSICLILHILRKPNSLIANYKALIVWLLPYLNMAIECCMMKTCPSSSVSHIHICQVRNQKFYKIHCIIIIYNLLPVSVVYVSVHVPCQRNLVNFVNILLLIIIITAVFLDCNHVTRQPCWVSIQ